MSQINDALKRAGETPEPPHLPTGAPSLPKGTVVFRDLPDPKPSKLPVLIFGAVLFVIVVWLPFSWCAAWSENRQAAGAIRCKKSMPAVSPIQPPPQPPNLLRRTPPLLNLLSPRQRSLRGLKARQRQRAPRPLPRIQQWLQRPLRPLSSWAQTAFQF